MVATPLKLEDALRLNGYTIEPLEIEASTITLPQGVLTVPPMLGSQLAWQRTGTPTDRESFYLTRLPLFSDVYKPVMLSHLLDHFRTRRIGYNTLDEFGLAVRRWGNLNLGPTSKINQWYQSGVTTLPLTTVDLVTEATGTRATTGVLTGTDGSTVNDTTTTNDTGTVADTGTISDTNSTTDSSNTTVHARDVESDFPDTSLSANLNYATEATDSGSETDVAGTGSLTAEQTRDLTMTRALEEQRVTEATVAATTSRNNTGTDDTTEHRTETGRTESIMKLVAEQRALFVSADELLLDEFEQLFLGVWDQPEVGGGSDTYSLYGYGNGFTPFGW